MVEEKNDSPDVVRTGGCRCGKVRYEVTGEPLSQVFCYCSECQAQTGSDHWFGVWYARDNFRFTGEPAKIISRKGVSAKEVHGHFCPDCAVTVCGDVTIAGFLSVNGPSFDDTEFLSPRMAVYVRSAPKWAVLPTDIPLYDTFPGDKA